MVSFASAVSLSRYRIEVRPTRITVSAGVATYPSGPEIDSMDSLVRAADAALYRAKDAGKDCVALHEPSARAGGGRA